MDVRELQRRVGYREDGRLFWKEQPSRGKRVGDLLAVRTAGAGYLYTTYNGKSIGLHRLVWAVVTGRMPRVQIDHIDLDKTNNRIANLREATRAENQWNAGARKATTSGLKGASWNSKEGKWAAQIRHNGKHTWLGYHDNPEAAHAAYAKAAAKLHGQFARLS